MFFLIDDGSYNYRLRTGSALLQLAWHVGSNSGSWKVSGGCISNPSAGLPGGVPVTVWRWLEEDGWDADVSGGGSHCLLLRSCSQVSWRAWAVSSMPASRLAHKLRLLQATVCLVATITQQQCFGNKATAEQALSMSMASCLAACQGVQGDMP
jgi:hypothetical protein